MGYCSGTCYVQVLTVGLLLCLGYGYGCELQGEFISYDHSLLLCSGYADVVMS